MKKKKIDYCNLKKSNISNNLFTVTYIKKKLGSICFSSSIPGIIKFWLKQCFNTRLTAFILFSGEILNSSAIKTPPSFNEFVRHPFLNTVTESLIVVVL